MPGGEEAGALPSTVVFSEDPVTAPGSEGPPDNAADGVEGGGGGGSHDLYENTILDEFLPPDMDIELLGAMFGDDA